MFGEITLTISSNEATSPTFHAQDFASKKPKAAPSEIIPTRPKKYGIAEEIAPNPIRAPTFGSTPPASKKAPIPPIAETPERTLTYVGRKVVFSSFTYETCCCPLDPPRFLVLAPQEGHTPSEEFTGFPHFGHEDIVSYLEMCKRQDKIRA
jgi:hypothetical protein